MVLVKLSPDPIPAPLFASLAFAANGSQVVVSGSTDSVHARVFMTEDLLDGSVAPLALHVAAKRRSGDGGARCVAAQDDCVVVATDSSEALLFSAFAFAFEKTLARLATPIHAARFRPRPNKLLRPHQEAAVAGEDAEIRIVNVDDITRSVVLKGHNDTIKALAFSPDGDFLASVDSLGDLHIWDLRGSKPISMRVLRSVVPATNVDLKDMGRISWHPNGKLLAIPGIHRDISILDTKTWTSVISLSGHSKLVTAVQYNHDGTAIASTDQSGKMYFWNASGKEKTPYKTIKNPSIVTDFSWHPTKNDVCFVLDSFEMEYLKDVGVLSSTVSTKDIAQEMDFETSHTDYKSKRGIDQDDTTRPAAKKTKTITSLDDEFEFDDDEDAAFNDFVVDDDGMGYADPIESRGDARNYYSKQILAPKTKGSAGFGGGYSSGMMLGNGLGGGGTEIQESFQPGATPLKGNKKYLAFNLLGVVYSVEQSTQSVIHVSHHDKSHRDYSFQDHYRFTMASMNSRGAVFATDPNSASYSESGATSVNTNSVIEYKSFENWGSNGSGWTIHLSPNENAKGICLTGKGVVVATDLRYLRFISFSGIQTDVRCLEGPVVAMAGEGDWLVVVYHLGGTFHGDQNLGYLLMNVAKGITVRKEGLSISPSTTLQWIGFSDTGLLASYDSSGVLRFMSPYDDFVWRPVFDSRIARDGKQLHYWPIGITETHLMCVICKSGDKHPIPPKAIISDVELKVPMLTGEGLCPAEEESILRSRITATHLLGKSHASMEPVAKELELKTKLFQDIDKQVVKQIVVACREEKAQKALELTQTLSSVKAIDGALKVAVSFKLSSLAHKINQVKEAFLKKEEELQRRQQVRQRPVAATPRAAVKTEPVIASATSAAAVAAVTVPKSAPVQAPMEDVQVESKVEKGKNSYPEDEVVNEFQEDPIPPQPQQMAEVVSATTAPNSAVKRGKGLSGLVKSEPMNAAKSAKLPQPSKPLEDAAAPIAAAARVKNPFAASNVGSSASFAAKPSSAMKAGSVGALFQDLKDSKEAKVAAAKEVKTELAIATKEKKQESLLGFFGKITKAEAAAALKSSVASTETSPIKGMVTAAASTEADDDMQLDAALDMLKESDPAKATPTEERVIAVGKENESGEFPRRSWEEKGKARALDIPASRTTSSF